MMGKPLNIIVIVFAVVGVVLASRLVVQTVFFSPGETTSQHEVAADERQAKAEDSGGGSHGGEEGESAEPDEGIYMINSLVINPARSGGRRHLVVSLGLEYHQRHIKDDLERLEPQIRDNLITLLAGQEMTVLSDISYREKIRKSLLKAVNYYLEEGQVEKLYFVKYVFQ
jgi:flagellar FliL protein